MCHPRCEALPCDEEAPGVSRELVNLEAELFQELQDLRRQMTERG